MIPGLHGEGSYYNVKKGNHFYRITPTIDRFADGWEDNHLMNEIFLIPP